MSCQAASLKDWNFYRLEFEPDQEYNGRWAEKVPDNGGVEKMGVFTNLNSSLTRRTMAGGQRRFWVVVVSKSGSFYQLEFG